MPGFLLIDKPIGPTSHDIVDKVRRITGEKRVGHAGTLDPFASGLLIVGVGREATREFPKLVGLDKTYEAVFMLGASSDTDDRMGTITPDPDHPLTPSPSERLPFSRAGLARRGKDTIEDALKQFVGEISQIPPAYSAIKIGGKKMYEAAREGKPLEAKPRVVNVYSITPSEIASTTDDTGLAMTKIKLTIHCSSGTYIRAIARDLGRALGTGGYVQELRRTSIGPFTINEAVTLENLTPDNWKNLLVSAESLLARL